MHTRGTERKRLPLAKRKPRSFKNAQFAKVGLGSTVGDLAATIHNDIARKLKHARVWGRGAFAGQAVGEAHVLVEGDVVEIHM